MEKATTTTTMNAIANNKKKSNLTKYIRNVQAANKMTAAQYECRLSNFEEYVVTASDEEEEEEERQEQKLGANDT